jgi:NADH dehydrogenase
MGRFVGRSLRDRLAGRPRGVFTYTDKGSMATIGRSRAVMDAMGLRLGGFVAWAAWVLVHLVFLVTFRNRVLVFTKWAWHWVTWDRASRLVWQGEGYPTLPRERRESTASPRRASG